MKFTKFGKTLLMSALSVGVVLSVTSCVQSYSVGYLYVTGTATAGSSGDGIISAYKIDHNTGKLSAVNGLPVSSGGANPVRAVLLSGSRFVYVLNRGTTASGGFDCTTANPCQNANITSFTVGANGILTPQEVFFTQGINPFRLLTDSSSAHLFVLDHDAQDNYAASYNPTTNACTAALGSGVETCGDITVFTINSTTGHLSLVTNQQVNAATGGQLTYFPVPANPVDFVLTSSFVLTLNASSTAVQSFPYVGGNSVFPYGYSSSSGQLTVSLNSAQPLTDGSPSGVPSATAIDTAGGTIYVLDNEPITVGGTTSPSQILPYTIGSGGSLQTQTGGAVPDDPTLSNPIVLLVESKSKWIYVANQGTTTNDQNTLSGIAAYVLTSPFQLTTMSGEPFGIGAGPQCMVEDPSNQYIYTANFNDSTITGRVINQTTGNLTNLLSGTGTYTLTGQPTWCFIDGRTG
jgi:6-phosphogluconolactonase (cycloisomerase 2 family)